MHERTNGTLNASVSREGYIPAIDGLRFFAIGSVLLYHLWKPLLPGGFVGVDVFFVISGFLITGVLTRPDHAPTLIQFYQNRIARIAPASLATIAAVLVAGYVLYDEQTFAYVGSAALFASISLINVKLLFQSSYFAASSDAQPLLHFWSLAVEEQFYLFYPALLIALRRLGWMWMIPVLALASLAACVALTYHSQAYAFYLLPTRAWELFAGGWLALLRPGHNHRQTLGWLGLGLILLSFAFVSETRAFPGWQAIVPVAAAMLMLDATRTTGSFSRFLERKPLIWVGLRSYSLYLWHWPVYSYADYALYRWPWINRLPVKIAATLVLALLSYELIEKPLRKALRGRDARILAFASFFAALAALCLVGNQLRNAYYISAEGSKLKQGGYLFNEGGKPRVTVMGDSESAMFGTVLRDLATQRGWRLRMLGAAGTNELPDERVTRWADVQPWLHQEHPDVVLIAYAWGAKLGDGQALDRALSEIDGIGARTVIVLQPPRPSGEEGYNPRKDGRLQVPEFAPAERLSANARVRALAARHKALVIDAASLFALPGQQVRVGLPGQSADYYDATHLARSGAQKLAPQLDQAIVAALANRQP